MYSYSEIKILTSVAMIVAPVLALFNCPCAISDAETYANVVIADNQGCCREAATDEDTCCASPEKPLDNDSDSPVKHKCGDSPCTCVVGEMRALLPGPQQHEIVMLAYACEMAPWEAQANTLKTTPAENTFRIPHTKSTQTHLMNCVFLC
jgi:hypothetical protein